MRRCLRTRSRKRYKTHTPGARTVVHFKKERPNYHECAACGAKLNKKRMTPIQARKFLRTEKRPERPMPHLCSKCMREEMKKMVR